jgi:hypothetical protein
MRFNVATTSMIDADDVKAVQALVQSWGLPPETNIIIQPDPRQPTMATIDSAGRVREAQYPEPQPAT